MTKELVGELDRIRESSVDMAERVEDYDAWAMQAAQELASLRGALEAIRLSDGMDGYATRVNAIADAALSGEGDNG